MLIPPLFVAGSALLGHSLLLYSTDRKLLQHTKLASPIQTNLTSSSETLRAELTSEFFSNRALLCNSFLSSSTARFSHSNSKAAWPIQRVQNHKKRKKNRMRSEWRCVTRSSSAPSPLVVLSSKCAVVLRSSSHAAAR